MVSIQPMAATDMAVLGGNRTKQDGIQPEIAKGSIGKLDQGPLGMSDTSQVNLHQGHQSHRAIRTMKNDESDDKGREANSEVNICIHLGTAVLALFCCCCAEIL